MIYFDIIDYELISICISIVALIVAIFGVVFSYKKFKITDERLNVAKESLEISKKALSEQINQALGKAEQFEKSLLLNIRFEISKARTELESLSAEDYQSNPKRYRKLFNSKKENLLNVYESACRIYIDDGVNKKDFKDEYREEIRDLFESESLRKYFDITTSRYKSMIKVYKEWENKT